MARGGAGFSAGRWRDSRRAAAAFQVGRVERGAMNATGHKRLRLAVLVSGAGTTLQALIDASAQDRLDAQVSLVVTNRSASHGIARALQAGIPGLYFPLRPYRTAGLSRHQYDADLAAQVLLYRPDLVVLAGWMHVLSAAFLERFADRVINLHPALPGVCPGAHALARTFQAYRRGEPLRLGCMTHYVTPELDGGPVLTQCEVLPAPHETLGQFEERMHAAEQAILFEALRLAADREGDAP
jgi:formyltetrahydrofolate-dependent phosphoribosylglycinamide formyltransferase